MTNGMRTEQAHLPLPLKKNLSVEALCDKARETGPKTPDFYSFSQKINEIDR